MKKLLATALAAAVIVPAIAYAQIDVGDRLGTSLDTIRADLESKGYKVGEIEIEDDEIEVEVTLDGTAYEIEISPETGAVVEIELDDDDDSDDD